MKRKIKYFGNPFIGLFVALNDKIAIIPENSPKKLEEMIVQNLDVEICKTSILKTEFIGLYASISNKGLICPKLEKKEKDILSSYIDILEFDGKKIAFGNIISMNKNGALISPDLEQNYIDKIKEKFKIKIKQSRIANYNVCGSCCISNENGFLVHYKTDEFFLDELKKLFDVMGKSGTINMGSGFVKTGLIANSKGYLVGEKTSGFEEGRIQEALGFI